jgi:aromatic-L-amino-acid/L-tryptophan decarboxylase
VGARRYTRNVTTTDRPALDIEQTDGLLDMDPEAFRAAGHEVVDLMADYLASVERFAVFPPVEPGSIAPFFPTAAPEAPEPIGAILDDYRRLVEPNATHWQHPGFLAYFGTTASGPGILGEMLTAAIGQNAMLWRTSPIATELEGVVVGWLRQAVGLPDAFDGLITDTASTSSLIALAGAREAAGGDVVGMRVYASGEAHSSIEKACRTLGLGRDALVRIPTNERFEMRVDELREAIARDRAGGLRPIAVVATVGTTSSTSVDSVPDTAVVAEAEGLWLHVDAAYAGAVAIAPELREPFSGWERADSIVINPHKWLFTPLDASLLLTRRIETLRAAFSLVPEYLRTLDRETPVRDYNEYTPQLGRRFRALKLWIQLRWFGLEGLRRRIRHHLELAAAFASWVDADPDWERLALVPFSTSASASGRRRSTGTTRRLTISTPESWMASIGPARCSCRTHGSPAGSRSGSRSATCGRKPATSSARGSCSSRPLERRHRERFGPGPLLLPDEVGRA